jgi:hypothetical protein
VAKRGHPQFEILVFFRLLFHRGRDAQPFAMRAGLFLGLAPGLPLFLDLILFFFFVKEVRNVKERIAFESDVDESRLHTGQNFHHAAFVNVADDALVLIASLNVEFCHHVVFDNGDLLFASIDADNHLFRHLKSPV